MLVLLNVCCVTLCAVSPCVLCHPVCCVLWLGQTACGNPTIKEQNMTCIGGGVVYESVFEQMYWAVQPKCDVSW